MGLVETEAIVLRTYRLAEADKIVVCLTQASGVVRGVARGARRLKSRFGAGLEPFTQVSLSYFEREGRELVSIRQAEILRSHFGLARRAEVVGVLDYMVQLAIEFVPPQQPDEKLYRRVRACIECAEGEGEGLASVVPYYELWLLKLAGFLPSFRVCGVCRKVLGAGEAPEAVSLSAEGALHCRACSGESEPSLGREALAQLRSMQRLGPAEWARDFRGRPKADRQELARQSRRLVERALERTPRVELGAAARHTELPLGAG